MKRLLTALYGYEFPPQDPELAEPAQDTPETITEAKIAERLPNGARFDCHTTTNRRVEVVVTFAAPGIIRVLTRLAGKQGRRERLARPPKVAPQVEIAERDREVSIHDADAAISIELQPLRLSFIHNGRVLLEQDPSTTNMPGHLSVLPLGVSELRDGNSVFHDSFRCHADEHFYGFGERFTDFDKRGQRVRIWMDNPHGVSNQRAYKNVPFFVSSRGYGIFVDSAGCCDFDMAFSNHAAHSLILQDDELDYYVLFGPDPATIIERYARLVGYPRLPPKWAFGLWVSGGALPDSAEATLLRAEGLRRREIPSDVLHIDSWQPEGTFSGLDWDFETFPDPAAFVREIHDLGYRLCLWISPYLAEGSPRYGEARDKDYLLKTPDGVAYVQTLLWKYPPVGIIDFTNPDAVSWWRDRLRALLSIGVDVFKTDFAEGVPPDAVAHNGMTGKELHNLYPLKYNDIAADITEEVTGRSGLVWGRSTHAGGQRHPAQWGGDPRCSWEDMASTLRGGLSLGMCGHPFWSHDMGGFKGKPTPELFIRWCQFGLLSPLSRLHGTTPRVPWEYGEDAVRIVRDFTRLRYRLLPYLYSQAVESTKTSSPILRAMSFQFWNDPATRGLDLQYMLGPDLLVAPVFNEENRVEIYFPAGRWTDIWSNEVIVGPGSRQLVVPLDRMPIYVRENALVPTIEAPQHIVEQPFASFDVDAYLISNGSLTVHDLQGSTTLHVRQQGHGIDLNWEGGMRLSRFRIIQAGGEETIREIRANGLRLEEQSAHEHEKKGAAGWHRQADSDVVVVSLT